jgi:uncharacterized protein YabE (DUF348 family)
MGYNLNMKRWLSLAARLLSLGLLLFLSLQKTIILVIDGAPQQHTTFALTVDGALRAARIIPGAGDVIQPPPATWLTEGLTITVERAVAVQIYAAGTLTNLVSAARRPADWLTRAGIAWQPGDVLRANGLAVAPDEPLPRAGSFSLHVIRPVVIHLHRAGETYIITTTAATLGQALWQAGIHLHPADRLTPAATTHLTATLTANLIPSQPITITTAHGSVNRRSAAASVGEALAEAGLAAQGLDYAIPAVSAPLPADGQIRLVRVREEVLIEQTSLPYGSTWQTVDDLALDERSLLRPGVYGIQASRVRVRFVEDVEISRIVESQWQAQAPVDELVGYGMKITVQSLDTPDGPLEYYRALQFWATSYAPKYVGGSTRTASGKTLQKGLVGVDTAYIPFGTRLYIPGYGFAEAADTGRISGRWIDLGYSDDDFEGWHQWVTVYFLWPPGYVPPFIPPPSRY